MLALILKVFENLYDTLIQTHVVILVIIVTTYVVSVKAGNHLGILN